MDNKNTINIINEDCNIFLKKIKNNSVNLILIDPPYIISKNSNFQNSKIKNNDTDRFRISMDFGEWDKEQNDWNSIFKEFYRILKQGGTLIIFWDIWKIQELSLFFKENNFKQLRFIEWIKTNPVPINSQINYLSNSREIAITGIKGSNPTFNSKYDNGIYSYPIERGKHRFHPTQKSLSLFKVLIEKHSNEGDMVLDCFLGGGTTALACLKTNRSFVGCEINKEYYDKMKLIINKLLRNKNEN